MGAAGKRAVVVELTLCLGRHALRVEDNAVDKEVTKLLLYQGRVRAPEMWVALRCCAWRAMHFDWVPMKMRMSGLRFCAALPMADMPLPGAAAAQPRLVRSPSQVLDETAISRLRELDPHGANHLLERVLAAFETSIARLMPLMQDARRSGDRAGIRHVAHTLKSSSASVGATLLSQLCAEIEAMVRQEHSEDLDQRIDAMALEVQVVLSALQQTLVAKP